MSEEGSAGITIAEKFFGLLLVIIGALAMYYTLEASQALLVFAGFFAFLSMILLVLGILLIIAKPELL
jgi:preprotein translocase subunit SecY